MTRVHPGRLVLAVACAFAVFARLNADAALPLPVRHPAELFSNAEARARVRDGALIGGGIERIERLPTGGLRVQRFRSYDHVQDPQSGKLATLPVRWLALATYELSPDLRLRRSQMTLSFDRSIDRALGRDASRRDFAWLFEFDRLQLVADASGDALQLLTSRRGHVVKRDHYAYPPSAVPIELASMVVGVKVSQHQDSFELDVMLVNGDVHGVEAEVHRTRDAASFARGYAVPLAVLRGFNADLAVVDLRLASPFKRLIFPHHFYFVYLLERPDLLIATWGGDPDAPMLAIREN